MALAYCIGAQKAGTSWLHHQLLQHPQVCFPLGKEPHYWDGLERGEKQPDHQAYLEALRPADEHLLGADFTPAYAGLHAASVAQLAGLIPDLRILFILRNPLERAWSAAQMYRRLCHMHPEETGIGWYRALLSSAASRSRSDYAQTIERWCAVFPRAQLRPLRYEALSQSPRAFLLEVCEFLELDPQPITAQPDSAFRQRINPGQKVPMPAEISSWLRDLYREPMDRLEALLDWDLSDWR